MQRNKLNNYDKSDHSISQTNGKGWPFHYLFRRRELYQEDPELNGYVINLQKLDDILRIAERKGTIRIEETTIEGIDDKTFEL